jgi:hypothetical protein
MSTKDELSRLLEAERREHADADSAKRGWQRLQGALAAGTPPMVASYAPLKLEVAAAWKWLLGTGAVGVVVGGVALVPIPESKPPTRAAELTVIGAAAPTDVPPTNPSPPPVETPPAISSPDSSAAERDATFSEELRLIKLARGEIQANRAHLAEVWLDEHARRFPEGVFRTEREALRILVTCASGNTTRGARRASDFVRTNPRSPLVDRISRACGLSDAAPPPDGSEKKDK